MTRSLEQLRAVAEAWIEGDPDPETQAELAELARAGDLPELESRLTPLTFGTAGLRAAVGAGSGRMNLAVVVRTAYGIARYLEQAAPPAATVVIGFDARPTSSGLAHASAEVLLAAGLRVVMFRAPAATPLVAFVGRELAAAISIVVTASHNPRQDNGYKVYGADAIQIIPPVDAAIARQIELAPPARAIARTTFRFEQELPPGLTLVSEALMTRYFAALFALPGAVASGAELRIVHSALHGVGSAPMLRALAEAGFRDVSVVAEQAEPDGTFPTTPLPNPEEPGTLDLALATARARGAELLLVSDPDADRLAAAARLDGELTVLDGNQVGALLADCLLARTAPSPAPLVLCSVVSSPLLAQLAAARGAHCERTHTGFKWLWSAALGLEHQGAGRFCFACEEALGYSVFPAVRDKDGIAAGRVLASLAASLAARGATLFDRLFELYAEHGLWASAARNVSLAGPGAQARVESSLDELLASAELRVGQSAVVRVVDYRRGAEQRAPWLGSAPLLELELEDGSTLFVRPSGTEPKLKLYGHVRRPIAERGALRLSLAEARSSAAALLAQLERALRL